MLAGIAPFRGLAGMEEMDPPARHFIADTTDPITNRTVLEQ
jgi:hypothetical protein